MGVEEGAIGYQHWCKFIDSRPSEWLLPHEYLFVPIFEIPSVSLNTVINASVQFYFSLSTSPQYALGCGRPSQIWTLPTLAFHAAPSRRIEELARHKTAPPQFLNKFFPQYYYGCGRESSIWSIHYRTLTCPNRPHTARLAQPKQYHPDYRPSRPVRPNTSPKYPLVISISLGTVDSQRRSKDL